MLSSVYAVLDTSGRRYDKWGLQLITSFEMMSNRKHAKHAFGICREALLGHPCHHGTGLVATGTNKPHTLPTGLQPPELLHHHTTAFACYCNTPTSPPEKPADTKSQTSIGPGAGPLARTAFQTQTTITQAWLSYETSTD